jgi:hypothetical protein
MTIDKVTAYSSGEEDELWFIPIVFDDSSLPASSPGAYSLLAITTLARAHLSVTTTTAAYEGEGMAVPAPPEQ